MSVKLPGIFLKIFLLGALNSFSIWSIPILLSNRSWLYAGYILISTLILDYVFLSKKRIAAKYLVPGAVLMIAFQVFPALFTGYVAFTNYSTGHFLDKKTAITVMVSNSYGPVLENSELPMQIARSSDSNELSMIVQEKNGVFIAGTPTKSTELTNKSVVLAFDGTIQSAQGYKLLSPDEVNNVLTELNDFSIPGQGLEKYRLIDFNLAEKVTPTLTYDASKDQITEITTGTIYSPNKSGSMVSADGQEIEPGWTATVGAKNFKKIVSDPRYSAPLLHVLLWTLTYPFLVVLFTFFLGLLLALTLNHPRMKSKRIYRSLLIVPYAMPSVLAILVWAGMFNEEFGVINRILHLSIPWLSDQWMAKVAVLLVQLWLGTPYMFLITTGAIQALPSEIMEAAEVDGASPRKLFTKIKLPLVLLSLTPLLIASYAFNFSNFGAIYLLTGGGPTIISSGGIAGYTDILISYTYKLAFTGGKGNDYGLASAVSFINFLIVALISVYSFKKSRTIENMS